MLAKKLYNFIAVVNVCIVHLKDTQGTRKWRAEWKLQYVQFFEDASKSQGCTTWFSKNCRKPLLHLTLDTSRFPHFHAFSHIPPTLLPHLSPAPCNSHIPTFAPTSSLSAFMCPHVTVPTAPASVLDISIPAAHPSSLILTHIMHSRDPTCTTLWDVRHVCTRLHSNWVLPAVRQILWDGIHCAVMSHSVSYHCLPISNCKFHFNSTCPNTLAYLPSPISQNLLSTSAHCSLCFV